MTKDSHCGLNCNTFQDGVGGLGIMLHPEGGVGRGRIWDHTPSIPLQQWHQILWIYLHNIWMAYSDRKPWTSTSSKIKIGGEERGGENRGLKYSPTYYDVILVTLCCETGSSQLDPVSFNFQNRSISGFLRMFTCRRTNLHVDLV